MVAGCGDDRDVEPASELERSAALELVDQTRALRGLVTNPTDRAALIASLRFDAVATLLAPNRTHEDTLKSVPVTSRAGGALPDCVTATATTATFSACEIDGHWVDGTISHAGPNVNAEIVDVFILDAGNQGITSIDGAVVLGPQLVDGTLSFDATWRQDLRDIALSAKISFESVVLDASGCPVGGTLTVAGSLSAPAREAERTLQFGPACGDVIIGR